MKKRNKKHEKRMKKLIVGCGLCAIMLTVATYAWFIGMKTVNVSSFDVEIAAIDSLLLSLDGETWDDEVQINKSNYTLAGTEYANNTNSWGGTGLIPMSTVGKINKTSSRLTLYEKGSLTETPGGYRIMASEVENTGTTEANGYVVFDLFIKNLSGNEYYKDLSDLNEEAIYLTSDSKVTGGTTGAENTGIENSVRVAFAQIGRVKATLGKTEEERKIITGISCTSDTNVTGICEDRDAQIWEPNDTKHVQNAINWYNTSCLKRSAADLTLDASYGEKCNTIVNGQSYQTYAVGKVIDYTDRVDVYDGAAYNGYTESITKGSLVAYPYFTDTMKNKLGTERPTFITLAPNSITKVRIYVFIEGQDVDNYDFASLGKKISVSFGFTKERFYDKDVNYDSTNTATLPDDVIKDKHWTAITTAGDN